MQAYKDPVIYFLTM